MKRNKIKSMLMASILSAGVLANSAIPAFAGTTDAAGSVGSKLTIEAKATSVNVTVPTSAPFIFNENGSNTLPSTFKVTNNSEIGGVYLSSISLDSKTNGWKVVDSSYNLKTMPVNTKNVRLKFGKTGATKLIAPSSGNSNAAGSVTFSSGEIDIEAKQSQTLVFEVERGAFSAAVNGGSSGTPVTAFDMTLQFKFQ